MGSDARKQNDILILGTGAIGSVIAAALSDKPRHRILAIGRSAHIRQIKANGLRLKGAVNRTVRMEVSEELNRPLDSTLLIVAVKASDLEGALGSVAPACRDTTEILLIQNGYGIKELAIRALRETPVDPRHIYRGIVAIAASFFLAGEVYYHGGTIRLEPAIAGSRFRNIFENTFLRTTVSRHFERDLWTKLVVNSVINPLSVILRANNHRLAASSIDPVKKQVLDEALRVATAEGVELAVDIPFINRFIDTNNYSSMYQDIVKKRKTEIRFITGALIDLADKHRIPVPVNRFLYRTIRAYESLHCE